MMGYGCNIRAAMLVHVFYYEPLLPWDEAYYEPGYTSVAIG